jgi:putrescine transport system ATP-binding protein
VIISERADSSPRPWLDPGATPQIVFRNTTKRYGQVDAVGPVDLSIYHGEIFVLVGASGCGKTTLLRMLGGFVEPTTGEVLIDGVDMTGIPPYERPVNMMFQSYALFPHMTVAQNVGYGLKRDPIPAMERDKRVAEALDMVQLGGLGTRKPHQLSGGQRQRVALARALIKRPKVLLLDEPLSALDKKLRESTQFELMDLQHELGTTFVIVTHDQDEAMALASRVAVMDQGRIVQIGTPAEVYEYPRTRFVAGFFGTANLLQGTVSTCRDGIVTVATTSAGPVRVRDDRIWEAGRSVTVSVRPEKLRLTKSLERGSADNVVPGEVWELGYLGNRSIYQVRTAGGETLAVFAQNERRTLEFPIDWGDRVHVSWGIDDAAVLDE